VGSSQARVLALACAFAGAVAAMAALFPFSPTAPTGMNTALAFVGLSLGAVLWRWSARVPAAAIHCCLALATAVMSLCVARSTTASGAAVTAYGFIWIALYTAWFHDRPAATAHVSGVALGLAAGLWGSGAPSPVQTWLFVMSSVGMVALVLNTLVRRLRTAAERDPLTGLLTRPAFATAARQAMALAARQNHPVSLALIDLDGFKEVNDLDGHAAGDELLATLAAAWTGVLRASDVLGRHGGDEFALVMPATTEDDATEVLARMRGATSVGRWSYGVAAWRGEDLDAWLAEADRALYARKRARR
jgi:diguanylate cyclase (GGDEF)-like protein